MKNTTSSGVGGIPIPSRNEEKFSKKSFGSKGRCKTMNYGINSGSKRGGGEEETVEDGEDRVEVYRPLGDFICINEERDPYVRFKSNIFKSDIFQTVAKLL